MKRPTGAAVLGLAALAFTGCSSHPPPSRAAYKSDVTIICNQANGAGADLNTPAPDPTAQLNFLRANLLIYSTGIKKIEALPQPSADKATLRSMWGKVDKAISLLNQAIDDQLAGKTAEAAALSPQIGAAGSAANIALSAYGLAECEEN